MGKMDSAGEESPIRKPLLTVFALLVCFVTGASWWHHSRDRDLSDRLAVQGHEIQQTQDRMAEHDRQLTDTRATVVVEQKLNAEQGLEIGKLRARMDNVEADLARTATELNAAKARLDQADVRLQELEILRRHVDQMALAHEHATRERDDLRRRLEAIERESLDSEERLRRIEQQLGITPRPAE
ncbi:MAG: hypothetical protein AB7O52_16350 [Planctomycetota bacterium]